MHFGAWVKSERKRRRMTVTECANAAGVSVAAWSKMESSTIRPEPETIQRISDILQIRYEDVIKAVTESYAQLVGTQAERCDPSDALYEEIRHLCNQVPANKRPAAREAVRQVLSLAR